MPSLTNTRASAARLCWEVIDRGKSLDQSLKHYFEYDGQALSGPDRGFVQELVYGVCRWHGELEAIAAQLLKTPIRRRERVIHFLLLTGLYQLRHLDTPQHAAVSETVAACRKLNKSWASKLLNGCLRNYTRQVPELPEAPSRLAYPAWIIEAIEADWPDWTDRILKAGLERPPMCLRVNRMQGSRNHYLERLQNEEIDGAADPMTPDGIILTKPVPVSALPGFFDGAVSVQDTAAQIACDVLDIEPGHTVLDACAAPGGKAAHLLERTGNQLALQALDISASRCEQMSETFSRLNLSAEIIVADAGIEPAWTLPPEGYDRILIDAPCSGLGVIRRHPDIKHHRTPEDVSRLLDVQQALLVNLWPLLKPGGCVLYMTCSILKSENEQQIERFLECRNDAMLTQVNHPDALLCEYGRQTLPGVHPMDGFYYCLITKSI